MHAITPDGKTLLVADAFGLTRVTLPNKVKTERKAMTSDEGLLVLDAAGSRALVFDDSWDQLHLLTVPDLARAASFARFAHSGSRLMADGQRLVRLHAGGLSVYSLQDQSTTCVPLPVASEGLHPLEFGRAGVIRAFLRPGLAVGADDTFAILRGEAERASVLVGSIGGDGAFVTHFERCLALRGGGPLRMTVERGGVTLRALEPGVATAYVLHLGRDGAADAVTLATLAMPERDGDGWVTQPAPDEVARCDAAGVVTARWPIADAAHQGVGEVLAHGGRAWFVPPHRECLVALPSGAVVSRKLSAKEAPVRAYYTPMLTRYNRAAAPFGRVFSLGRTAFWNHDTQVQGSLTLSSGDGSLGANVITAALYGELADGDASALLPFHRGGTGMGGYSSALRVPVTEPEVARLFAACDAERVWLLDGVDWLKDLYERRLTARSRWSGEPDAPPGELVAERVLLRGILHHASDASVPALTPHLDAWRGDVDDVTVCAALTKLGGSDRVPARAYEGVAWMVARLLAPDAAVRVFVWMLLDGAARVRGNSEAGVRGALEYVLEEHPALRGAAVALVEAHAPAMRYDHTDLRAGLVALLRGEAT